MNTLNLIKKESLKARKEKNTVRANLLTTLYSEAINVGKNDGNRETTEEEVQKMVRKFIKNNKISHDARPEPQLMQELDILNEFVILPDEVDFKPLVDKIIEENQDKWEIVKTKPQNVSWFYGQTMKATNGKANPETVKAYIEEKLNA